MSRFPPVGGDGEEEEEDEESYLAELGSAVVGRMALPSSVEEGSLETTWESTRLPTTKVSSSFGGFCTTDLMCPAFHWCNLGGSGDESSGAGQEFTIAQKSTKKFQCPVIFPVFA